MKSGCFCCPYQPKDQWQQLRIDNQDLFNEALEMETLARANGFSGGLYRSEVSIQRFNFTHTLMDFGMTFEDEDSKCDPGGGCFL